MYLMFVYGNSYVIGSSDPSGRGEIMKNRGAMQWAALVLSILFAVGVQTVFRSCPAGEDGSWMHCHDVQRYLFVIGIVLAAASAAGLFVRSRTAALVLSAAVVILAAAAVLLPGTIMPMCMMDTMRCHAMMKPFARVMGILLVLVSLIDIIKILRTK